MRPLPRLLAVTTDQVCRDADYGVRAAAVAAAGPAVGLLVRAPDSTAAQQAAFAVRTTALARPPEAAVIVHGRPDLARAVAAQGTHLRRSDLTVADARRVLGSGWVGVSVHSEAEARAAADEGADYLLAGSVFASPTHPGSPPQGLPWLERMCRIGPPVIAIGGLDPSRAEQVRAAGAWGVAAVGALWNAPDPAAAATALIAPWSD